MSGWGRDGWDAWGWMGGGGVSTGLSTGAVHTRGELTPVWFPTTRPCGPVPHRSGPLIPRHIPTCGKLRAQRVDRGPPPTPKLWTTVDNGDAARHPIGGRRPVEDRRATENANPAPRTPPCPRTHLQIPDLPRNSGGCARPSDALGAPRPPQSAAGPAPSSHRTRTRRAPRTRRCGSRVLHRLIHRCCGMTALCFVRGGSPFEHPHRGRGPAAGGVRRARKTCAHRHSETSSSCSQCCAHLWITFSTGVHRDAARTPRCPTGSTLRPGDTPPSRPAIPPRPQIRRRAAPGCEDPGAALRGGRRRQSDAAGSGSVGGCEARPDAADDQAQAPPGTVRPPGASPHREQTHPAGEGPLRPAGSPPDGPRRPRRSPGDPAR